MLSSLDSNLNTVNNFSFNNEALARDLSTAEARNASTIATNPNAVLDKDAFLKLLLVELQHQDPTDPMDSDKMLTQTSQLSALEMQQNTNTTMQKMVETMQKLANSFSTSMSTSALAAIGKMATVVDDKIKLTGPDELIALKMYLPEDSDENGVTLEIYDSKNKLIFSEKSEAKSISKGLFTMEWPGRDNEGIYAGDGEYSVKMVYNNKNGEKISANYGTYPIEGVVFKEGIAYAKMAGQEVSFDFIREISDYKFNLSSNTSNNTSNDNSSSSDDSNSSNDNLGSSDDKNEDNSEDTSEDTSAQKKA